MGAWGARLLASRKEESTVKRETLKNESKDKTLLGKLLNLSRVWGSKENTLMSNQERFMLEFRYWEFVKVEASTEEPDGAGE
jgi:hypothetical protein